MSVDARNIVLMGFMGTGKSAVGKRLAEILKRPFVDMDSLIEDRAKKTIANIFKEDGEREFRKMERAVTKELAERGGLVVAAGGGLVLDPHNVADYARTGFVVCLTASKETLLARLALSQERPLLREGELKDRVSRLLIDRKRFYDAIPHQVDTSELSVDEVVAEVLALFNA